MHLFQAFSLAVVAFCAGFLTGWIMRANIRKLQDMRKKKPYGRVVMITGLLLALSTLAQARQACRAAATPVAPSSCSAGQAYQPAYQVQQPARGRGHAYGRNRQQLVAYQAPASSSSWSAGQVYQPAYQVQQGSRGRGHAYGRNRQQLVAYQAPASSSSWSAGYGAGYGSCSGHGQQLVAYQVPAMELQQELEPDPLPYSGSCRHDEQLAAYNPWTNQ